MRGCVAEVGNRRVPDHGRRGHAGPVDHGHGTPGVGRGQILVAGRPEHIEPEQQVHRTGGRLDGGVDRAAGDADVGRHRAALLGQARLVQAGGVEAVEVCGHLQDARDGDHAGPTDAGQADQEVVGRATARSHTQVDRWFGHLARCGGATPAAPAAPVARSGVTRTKDGQSPLRHDRSSLHEPWWTAVLRPNSVSIGTTDRQLDFSPQSPQPSHTLGLIHTGWSARPAGRAGAADVPPPRSGRRGSAR